MEEAELLSGDEISIHSIQEMSWEKHYVYTYLLPYDCSVNTKGDIFHGVVSYCIMM